MPDSQPRPVVFIVHTSFVSVQDLTALFHELGPELELHHIVDDSLLREVLAHGGVTPAVRRRVREYYRAAELAGASLIFNQCSSVGEAADAAARVVHVPVVKVDSAMAWEACRIGARIGVVATLETTLGPTCRLVERTARRMRRKVGIVRCLVRGAFEKLMGGDRPGHNAMVIAAIRDLTQKVDVVVCAQGSMVTILAELGPTRVPVLTSPRMGVESAVRRVRERAAQPCRTRPERRRRIIRSVRR